jgi:4-amino-4-deoxy-L-arabinose transferase-like glycosyltransferase
VPNAVPLLVAEYRAERNQFHAPWYYLGLLGLVFPWTFALLRALLRWSQREFRPTGRRALPWAWFLFTFVLLSLPGAKQQRYVVPVLPATGLIIADAWLAGTPAYQGRWRSRVERLLTALHWVALLLAAVLLALFLLLQDRLTAAHILPRAELVGLAPWLGLVLLPLLLALVGLGWRRQRAGRQAEAAWISAAIMALIATVTWYGYAPAPAQQLQCRQDILRAHARVGGEPLYFLNLQRTSDRALSKEFLMYTRRIVPVLDPPALAQKIAAGGSFFVATRMAGHGDADLGAAGLRAELEFRDGEKLPLRLFHREGTNALPAAIGPDVR